METPQELGLPAKFRSWQNGQDAVIAEISASGKKHYLLDAPTGVGKSVIGIAAYKVIAQADRVMNRIVLPEEEEPRPRCIYVTRTKQLQDQIIRDFPEARTIKGRSNYRCLLQPDKFPAFTAEHCHNSKECKHKATCPYWVDKRLAMQAPIAVLNDAYYLAEVNGPGQFRDAEYVILDEVDSLESALMNFIQFTVSEKQLARLQIPQPRDPDSRQSWLAWGNDMSEHISMMIARVNAHLNSVSPSLWSGVELDLKKLSQKLANFYEKVRQFTYLVNDSWLFFIEGDEGERKWTFKPVTVDMYADTYLWRHVRRSLGMSATIFDPVVCADEIGMVEYGYKQVDSPFPVENRPILFWPVASLARKLMEVELPKMARAVAEIMTKHPGDKILVHTVSNELKNYLLSHLSYERLITHITADRNDKLDEFRLSPDPLVMLSPSFDRGVDLPDDQCRVVIICKVPYLNLSDKQVEARLQMPGGQRWYELKAAQTLVQMTGRGVRGPKDYCDTYILDRKFERLWHNMRLVIPKWWQDAIRRVDHA